MLSRKRKTRSERYETPLAQVWVKLYLFRCKILGHHWQTVRPWVGFKYPSIDRQGFLTKDSLTHYCDRCGSIAEVSVIEEGKLSKIPVKRKVEKWDPVLPYYWNGPSRWSKFRCLFAHNWAMRPVMSDHGDYVQVCSRCGQSGTIDYAHRLGYPKIKQPIL